MPQSRSCSMRAQRSRAGAGHARPSCPALPRRVVHESREILYRKRLRYQETLRMVAADARQVRESRRIADAFGRDPAAQVMAEVDDGADDRAVLSIPAHLFHEQLVDLQLTHRQASQVGK